MKAHNTAMVIGALLYIICYVLSVFSHTLSGEMLLAGGLTGAFIFIAGFMSYVKER